ncbi:methyl-accepting chemotaxis sensory transducer with Pas/Pac sensor [Andreprevotia lacus DSM 23236]|jgi:methyl-accepting chemotaxis protein|uniref:Methyl-accepting chemotaxis sensory transducer with Pas/Pac sensor n=1 Tax=Andreprevotia lacus DSM 23236 TaxID=1121001 RepID=A0A1W1XVS8_9NEIS|nr:PAS domain-containing methyl-accepting chemotaxis protein [Andreprevotia lacus]SMC28043.1 methyl-accepting chemotaxis sensory transducer with Pas/Pac sensor [Andreprevotia lacus DSM 23236]
MLLDTISDTLLPDALAGKSITSDKMADVVGVLAVLTRYRALAMIDTQGLVQDASPALLTLFNLGASQPPGLSVGDLFPDAPLEALTALAQGELRHLESHSATDSGEPLFLRIDAYPLDGGLTLLVIDDHTALSRAHIEDSGKVSAINNTQAVVEFDLGGHILYANEQFLDSMGFALDEVVGQHHRMFCLPDYAESPEYAAFWAALAQGYAKSGEFLRVNREGEPVWLQATYTPIKGPNGVPYKVIEFASDITAAKRKTLEDEGKLAAINRTQAIIEFALDGTILTANPLFLDTVHYPLDEIIGQHHSIFCLPDYAASAEYAAFWAGLRAGEPKSGEFMRLDKHGKTIWLQATYAPILGVDGKPVKVVKFCQDITAAKQKALEDDSKLAAVNRTQAAIEFDLDGNILNANPLFLRTMGYGLDAIRGKHHRMFCPQGYADSDEYRLFWDELRAGKARAGEFMRVNSKGEPVWLQATYTPVAGLDGKPLKIVKYASDITATKLKSIEDDGKVAAIERSQGVIEFDMAGNIISANDNFLQLMGYELGEVQGQHHRMFVERDEAAGAAYRAFWQKLGRGEFDSGEYLRLGKNGKRIWIQATYNPILDLEGRPVKVVKFCSDITAAKLANIETQARMDAVSVSSCILDLGRDGTVLGMNDLLERALGYSRSELIGKNESAIMFAEDIGNPNHQDNWNRLREGKPLSGEFRRKGSGERELWFGATFNPVLGLDGLLTKVVVIAQDITEDKRTRLDNEGKLKAIDRSEAMIEFDLSGKVLSANENFLKLMDYRIEEVLGRHHRMFVDPAFAASADYQAFWERLARGEREAAEYRRIGRGGREVWLQATYNPIFDPGGKPVKVVKFATDVTELKLRGAESAAKIEAVDLGQAVVEFDLDGNVLTANRNFLAAMGYTMREILGHHHSIFCTSEYTQGPEYREFWLKLGEGQFISGRFHRVGKYSRDVWLQASYNPIRDLNGKVVKVVKYAYDVTREVKLQRQITARSDTVAATLRQLSDSIELIADNAGQAAQTVQDSAQAANAGFEAVRQSRTNINQVQASAQKVSEIVRVISEIANQTNLLAFNAAIEAARAGQYGVGFSVVAAEVRKLAERSAAAAKEISQLIETSVQQVNAGAEVNDQATRQLENIIQAVRGTATRVDEIGKAADGQRSTTGEVSAFVRELSQSVSD